MIIKEIDTDDYHNAINLYCLCFNKEYKEIKLPLLGNLVGLYLEEKLIGLAQIDYINNVLESKKIAYINSLCIHPNYRNKRLGDKLLKECIKISKEKKCDYINLTSNPNRLIANKMYKSNDFIPLETKILKKDLI